MPEQTVDVGPARARSRRWLPILVAIASAAAVGLAGVMQSREPMGTERMSVLASTRDTAPAMSAPAATLVDSTAYAVAIRHELATKPTRFSVLWILDAPHTNASESRATPRRHPRPFDHSTRHAIETALKDLAPVRWVREAAAAKTGRDCDATVRGNGLIITLSPIRFTDDRAEVGLSSWHGCEAGHWATYRLDKGPGRAWGVTAVVGAEAIS